MAMDAGFDSGEPGAGSQAGGQAESGFSAASLPDPRKLAQDWITLWQSELSAMAADPELRESWQAMMSIWAGAMAAMVRGMPRAPTSHEPAAGHPRSTDAPRPSAAAAAPDARDAEIERLASHVAALERRLAELER